MVVKPDELMQRIQQNEQQAYQALEQRIDKSLEDRFDGTGAITFGFEMFKDIRKFVREDLLGKYKRAGWDVREFHDQRDGDYVQFTYRAINNNNYVDMRETAAYWDR